MNEKITASLLEMQGISKVFPGVKALNRASFTLHAGEVHALMGENGAGKSTLMKVLAGVYQPDEGSIAINGQMLRLDHPQIAQQQGIAVIYQEFNLVPMLTVRENIFLGREQTKGGFFSKNEEHQQTLALFERLNVPIDPEARCADLSVAQQQLVEIAKALSVGAKIVVMDEPSAALTVQEVEALFKIIADLKAQGIGIVYVSHRLEEVFAISDRITVMRDGETITTQATRDLSRASLIEAMVGRSMDTEFPKEYAELGQVALEVKGLKWKNRVKDVSFSVRKGELLGITGLVGAGRTELVRMIFGADLKEAGEILVHGKAVTIRSPRDAIRHRICLLTEDRKTQGLILDFTVQENFSLPNLPQNASTFGFVRFKDLANAFQTYLRDLKIKVSSPQQVAGTLSGGNQQKVVLAKWLQSNADIILIDEPTRGIDVGAKYEIYLLMNQLAKQGKAIVMISSELPEILGMSDRILVMHEGRITGEITAVKQSNQEQIMGYAMGNLAA